MIRNGITIPFPSELATPPVSSSQTGRGSSGLSPLRYAATAFSAAKGNAENARLPSALSDSSIELRMLGFAGVPGRGLLRDRNLLDASCLVQGPRLQEVALRAHHLSSHALRQAAPSARRKAPRSDVPCHRPGERLPCRRMTTFLAYIDAGSGSLLLQALTGGVAAGAVLARVYWRRLRRFLHIGKPEDESSQT